MKQLLLPYFLFTRVLEALLTVLRPLALLAARCYVGWVFFSSGLTKIKDWDTTLFLFEEEYAVPFLSPDVAAYLGTGGELLLPVLLVFGLLNPIAVIGLSILNVMAVLSLEDIAPAAFSMHVIWGMLLAAVLLWGPGRLSISGLLGLRAGRG